MQTIHTKAKPYNRRNVNKIIQNVLRSFNFIILYLVMYIAIMQLDFQLKIPIYRKETNKIPDS